MVTSASSAASKADGAGFTLPLNHNNCYRKSKMFLVFYAVFHPVTREPLLTVGQKITNSELIALSENFNLDTPKQLQKQGVIHYIGP